MRAKLKSHQMREIHELHQTGVWTQDQLAARFGVSRKTIYRVLVARGVITPRLELTIEEQRMIRLIRGRKVTLRQLLDVTKPQAPATEVPRHGQAPGLLSLVNTSAPF